MGRKCPEISPEVRKLAVDLHQNGHRLCDISKFSQLSYVTVCNIVKRFLQSGSVENKARSGSWPVIVELFPDDHSPVHRSRVLQEYRATYNLKSIFWPAQSPDLNVIENIWLYIKRKLAYRHHVINSDRFVQRNSENLDGYSTCIHSEPIFICSQKNNESHSTERTLEEILR